MAHGLSRACAMDYLQAFESCPSFNPTDRSISRSDLPGLCQRYGLRFDSRQDPNLHETRIKFETFKLCVRNQTTSYHDDLYLPSSPPPRPGSGGRLQRKITHNPGPAPSSSHPHSRAPLQDVASPREHGGGYEREYPVMDDHNWTHYRDSNRTPDYVLSPDEQPRRSDEQPRRPDEQPRRPDEQPRRSDEQPRRPSRDRQRQMDIDHTIPEPRRDQERVDSPPLHLRRSSARSHRGDDSEGSDYEGLPYQNHVSSSLYQRRTYCKHCRRYQSQNAELQEKVKRLEKDNEGLTKELHAAQNSDLQYSKLMRDNARLRQELKKTNRGPEHDVDSKILDRQVKELKAKCESLEADVRKKKEYIFDLKGYKKEYSSLRQKYENQQRENWRMQDEIHKLQVRVMELERGALIGGRRPGISRADDRDSELRFERTTMRQTYHFGSGKAEGYRDSHSRKSSRLEMKRASSAAQVLDNFDEPQKEEHAYSRPKSHRSGTYSDVSSVAEAFPTVTTHDEQSQVFAVMDEVVSKSVLPDTLTAETKSALIYALQNCHSIQEIIKCFVSYGVGTPEEKVQGFKVENDYLNSQIGHLKAKNTVLAHSFENAKANMENMYSHSTRVESNNTRLLHALKHCYQACEIYEVLLELRIPDRRMSTSNPHYFPSFDYSSLESSTRSPDREQHSSTSSSSGKPPAVLRARNLLHSLDSDAELQNFLPGTRSRPNGTDYRQTVAVWGSSSQNTGTTSGLSSMSGGMEGDITPEEIERLRLYIQALILRKNHYTSTLIPIEGRKGLEMVKDWELVKDCLPAGHGGQIMDLEDAANVEELCKVREEKAELRSQIYMMDQEKRRMELEVARMLLHKQKNDKIIVELQFQLERRRRKREKKNARRPPQAGEAPPPPHDAHQPLSVQLQLSLERERELMKRYEDLFGFLAHHTKESHHVSEDLMGFVRDLWRQNSSLVDAFEKTKKRQLLEKKRMKQELVSLMNQVHNGNSAPTNEEPTSGTAYP